MAETDAESGKEMDENEVCLLPSKSRIKKNRNSANTIRNHEPREREYSEACVVSNAGSFNRRDPFWRAL